MKKALTTLFLLTFLCTSVGYGQWTFQGAFPDTGLKGTSGAHGLAVDPAGKVWLITFGQTGRDSIFNGTAWVRTIAIHVFNANGTPAPFSPIKTVTVGAVTDTLFSTWSNRGIRADRSGNILASVLGTGTNASRLYRINYQTGQGMNRILEPGSNGSPGVDTLGEIFLGRVAPGNPIKIYDNSFAYLGNVVDTSVGFHRALEVSPNGNDVYWAGYTNHAIYRYHSDNGSIGPYTVGPNDTLLRGFDCESMGWNPPRTRLWLSAGSKADAPNRYPNVVTNYSINTWYAYNPSNGQITDSIKWDWRFSLDSTNVRPRAIGFSPDGNTAYVGCFGGSGYPPFLKYSRVSNVKPDPEVIPAGFILAQNYPNPFNPTTEIRFQINKAGHTTLVVYDITGKEVETLLDQELAIGGYTATFDASKLASGTYFYRLTQDGQSVAKKMLLTK